MDSETLYLVMPAYNEEDNIVNVVREWYPILSGKAKASKFVIADCGSTDRTHDRLLELSEQYPALEILSDTKKEHGPKVLALYRYAIQMGADYVFQTDSDGQTDPAEFVKFWEMRHEYDAICGNRTHRQDGKGRALVEHTVCFLLKLFFGVKIPDANAPFRLMKTSVLNKYIGRLPQDYHLPNIMLTVYFKYYKERIAFSEIAFRPRQGGVNSIDFAMIAKIGWKAQKDFRSFRKEMKKNP